MKIFDPASDLKTCGYISFEMLNSKVRPDCRDLIYLRYIDSKAEETFYDIFITIILSVIFCQSWDRYSYMRKVCISVDETFVVFMEFDLTSRPYSGFCRVV